MYFFTFSRNIYIHILNYFIHTQSYFFNSGSRRHYTYTALTATTGAIENARTRSSSRNRTHRHKYSLHMDIKETLFLVNCTIYSAAESAPSLLAATKTVASFLLSLPLYRTESHNLSSPNLKPYSDLYCIINRSM